MQSFDLCFGNSFDWRESVDEVGEFGPICAEIDGPTKQKRGWHCCFCYRNQRTGFWWQNVSNASESD
jgi:hypothetical protein